MQPKRICVVTGTRAEYGLLRWVMAGIRQSPVLELQLTPPGTGGCRDPVALVETSPHRPPSRGGLRGSALRRHASQWAESENTSIGKADGHPRGHRKKQGKMSELVGTRRNSCLFIVERISNNTDPLAPNPGLILAGGPA